LQALRGKVLSGLGQPVAITGKTARVGLQGMGGIGKSVLESVLESLSGKSKVGLPASPGSIS